MRLSAAAVARARISESISVLAQLSEDPERAALVVRIAETITDALRAGHKVLIFGNGGSAADAQHIAGELLGRYLCERRSLPAVALADSTAALTAIANDYDYSDVFARQLAGLGAPGDVALGLSTSGHSRNVVRAMEVAREAGLITIALTGALEGPLSQGCDLCLRLPSTETPRVQESYMVVAHTICELVEREFTGDAAV